MRFGERETILHRIRSSVGWKAGEHEEQDSPGSSPELARTTNCRYTRRSSRKQMRCHLEQKPSQMSLKAFTSYLESAIVLCNAEAEQRCVFLPTSPFLYQWDVVILILSVMVGVYEPVRWAFTLNSPVDAAICWFYTLIFGADTTFSFFRASKESTQDGVILITFVPDIARRYIFGAFALDFITTLPLAFYDTHLGLLRMLRLWRLGQLLSHFQNVTGFSFSWLNLTEFILVSLLVLHWISCLWLAIGLRNEESWLSTAQENLTFFNAKQSRINVYLLSLYWSVTVLTSVGFGDITPESRSEFVCALFCMGVGGAVWAYILGNVCGMVQQLDKHRLTFESTMNDVNVICNERRLPEELQARVREFYHHAREFLRMQQYHSTIADLSPALKGEVVRWMYGRCFRRVWYFDCMEDRCVSVLVEGMCPKMFAPQEFIEAVVGTFRAIVFLRSGLCVRKCNLLAPGSVWGTDVILSDDDVVDFEHLIDTALARSISFAYCLMVGKDSLDHVASLYPNVAARFRKAHTRMLICRGVVAVARAAKRMQKQKDAGGKGNLKVNSKWDRLAVTVMDAVHEENEGQNYDGASDVSFGRSLSIGHRSTSAPRLTTHLSRSFPVGDVDAVLPKRSSWREKVEQQIEMRLEQEGHDVVCNTQPGNAVSESCKSLSRQASEEHIPEPVSLNEGDHALVRHLQGDVAHMKREMFSMRQEISELSHAAVEQTRIMRHIADRLGAHEQIF